MKHDDVENRFRTLSPAAREEVLRTLGKEAKNALAPIPRRNPEDKLVPLALAQHRLWLLNELRPDNRAYNEVIAFELRGSLNFTALQQALDEIVRRHEPLRTTFPSRDGVPLQAIGPAVTVPIGQVDLRHLNRLDQETNLQGLAESEQLRTFELSQGPLLRVQIAQLGEDVNVLLISAHHIVLDGWSVGLFQRELAALYSTFDRSEPPPTPAPQITYGDFAAWQAQTLQTREIERQIGYWRRQLSGVPATLNLPIAKPRPDIETFRGAKRFFSLERELCERLRTFSVCEGVTLFMTLSAAFYALLYRFSAETDLAIGTAVANRTRAEVEHLIGCFVNTLVLRVKVSGSESFRNLVRQVQCTAIAAYDHADVPFDAVVEAIRPERSASHNPIVQVFFVLQSIPKSPVVCPLDISVRHLQETTSKFDLILSIEDGVDGISGYCQYNTDLFQREAIEQLLNSWDTILHAAVEDPSLPVDDLSVVSPAWRERLLFTWNRTDIATRDESCLELIEQQAERVPEAPAITSGGSRLTYVELNLRVAHMALQLQTQGVGSEDLVGILLPRSMDFVVSVLGILKAGGGYVPLDPSWPGDQLRRRASDARLKLIVTNTEFATQMPFAVPTLLVNRTELNAGHEISRFRPPKIRSEQTAYVMYTSGSTGDAKGVVVTRGNLDHSTIARRLYYRDPVTAFLLLSPFTFDSSVAGIFWTLTQGGNLIIPSIPSGGAPNDPAELCSLIEKHRVSHLLTTPSFYGVLLDGATRDAWLSVRSAIVAGEQCPQPVVGSHRSKLGDIPLYNEYGPTEATVWSTVHLCGDMTSERVPIGKPIPNARVYILDQRFRPVPVGIPGEIYVGGAGVARGYLGQPELTAEHFLPDPFRCVTSARVYKTGDIGRYLSDGSIEMLGRKDRQVKVRGFRLELDGIESVLLRHPQVRDAAVVLSEDDGGNAQVVACIEFRNSSDWVPDDFYGYIDRMLLPHERPVKFQVVQSLPRLTNGKIDRAALTIGSPKASVSPIKDDWSDLERAVAVVCGSVFRFPEIGLDDNFFAVGADSLSIILAYNQLRAVTSTTFTITDLFKYPTVRSIAAILGKRTVAGRI